MKDSKQLFFTITLFITIILINGCEETVTPPAPTPPRVPTDYSTCLAPLTSTTLDVVTWNLENFSSANTDIIELIEIIIKMDADIIAVQEIKSIKAFNLMVDSLDGWQGTVLSLGGLNTGYLYKVSEITQNGDLFTIYDDNFNAFPRPPVVGNFTHISGTDFTAINLHLKCCGGNENEDRRREASTLLKLYIDDMLDSVPVLVVGDFNDLIEEPAAMNVFQNIINDSINYRFADMEIAQGSDANWSYPSWPSQIDHILMTNELFDSFEGSSTIRLDDCLSRYDAIISDHRPVMARFNMK